MFRATRAFATLPPGTVSPVMAATIMDQSSRSRLALAKLRQEGRDEAALAAKKSAESAEDASAHASLVAQTPPSSPVAGEVAESAVKAQYAALDSAREAEIAAYQLESLQRMKVAQLESRPRSQVLAQEHPDSPVSAAKD